MEGFIGSPIREKVYQQLKARQEIVSKQTGRSTSDLVLLTSSTPWVRISSGVNELTQDEIDRKKANTGSIAFKGTNELAKNNILQGGLFKDGTLLSGIESTTNSNLNAAYRSQPTNTGIRPMPGIKSLSVKSKNTFGTLREATVELVAWTLQDFELIEKLYLRPGFTVLLEWGHSIYVDNTGKVNSNIETCSSFFSQGSSLESLVEDVKEVRERSDYNYEAMVGVVKNFNWRYGKDGGYHCSISVISTGEILESVKLRKPVDEITKPQASATRNSEEFLTVTQGGASQEDQQTSTRITNRERQSLLNYFIGRLFAINKASFTDVDLKKKLRTSGSSITDFKGFRLQKNTGDLFTTASELPLVWVPLRTVIQYLSEVYNIYDPTTRDSQGRPRRYVKFLTDPKIPSKFVTGPNHFSVDPTHWILPSKPQIQAQVGGQLVDSGIGTVRPIHAENTAVLATNSVSDDILSIFVSANLLLEKAQQFLEPVGGGEPTVFDFLKDLLEDLEACLGNINEFDIDYREEYEGGTYVIVDRRYTPKGNKKTPELTIAGLNSVVLDVNISSKLSNEVGSTVAIAAQGASVDFVNNVHNILKWNPDIVDRIRTVRTISSDTGESDLLENSPAKKLENRKEWFNAIYKMFKNFNNTDTCFNSEELGQARSRISEFFSDRVIFRYESYGSATPVGLIPVELSLTFNGIAGFVVGETFKIAEGILPAKYQDRYGYIITGLEHKVELGGWTTEVTTQFYLLEGTNTTSVQEQQQTSQRGVNKGATPRTDTPAYTSLSCTQDSKIQLSPNFNLGKLSCGAVLSSARFSVPDESSTKSHPVYGNLTRAQIVYNLKQVALNILEPLQAKYPNLIVTNGYRNKGGRSQHEAGMAVDIQFSDIQGSTPTSKQLIATRAKEILQLLSNFDELILEYAPSRTLSPWIHISFNIKGNRKKVYTYLNDSKYKDGIIAVI